MFNTGWTYIVENRKWFAEKSVFNWWAISIVHTSKDFKWTTDQINKLQ